MPERSRERATGDPFAITPDPNFYVPRAATEIARKELLRSACNPTKTSALIGPAGLGKTLLLQLLAEEVPEDLQTVYLPYAVLPAGELCAWALGLLGLPTAADPIGALKAYSRELRAQGSSLLMLIDDAGSMPVATARWAGDLVQDSGGGVRLAIAASDNATGNRTIAAIGSNFDIVHLDDPMTESETSKYIEGRLALARVPDSIRARFDGHTVRFLHRISAGIPRRLHSAASAILQQAPVALSDNRTDVSAAPVDVQPASVAAPSEQVAERQTLGVPTDERRIAKRRAEPEGIAVRVGLGGPPSQKGRRAEDRVESMPGVSEFAGAESAEPEQIAVEEPGESAPIEGEELTESAPIEGEEFAESASIEGEVVDDDWVSDREPQVRSPVSRRAPPASRRAIVFGTLLVASAAVAIPVIRSILSELGPIAESDRQQGLGESTRRGPGQPKREGLGESLRGDLGGSRAALEPAASLAREELAEIRAAAVAEATRTRAPSAVEAPIAKPVGSIAVQINASPWANVEVDGIDLGATPLANIPLFEGVHAFRVKMPDGRVIERTIEIDAHRRFISFE
ncbi:MAG TPA: AAA family ATPase [Myxococcota bacterium]